MTQWDKENSGRVKTPYRCMQCTYKYFYSQSVHVCINNGFPRSGMFNKDPKSFKLTESYINKKIMLNTKLTFIQILN